MNRIPYKIFENFSNIKEKECVEADKHNETLYKNTIKKVSGAIMIINKTGILMNIEVPKPPSPNNYQKYVLYKKRNVVRNVIHQSKAISYLFEKNYKLDVDYEAYQAIDVANWIKKLNNESGYILSGNEIDEQNENINTSNIFRQFNNIGVSQESPIISRRNTMRERSRPSSTLSEEQKARRNSCPIESAPPLYPNLDELQELQSDSSRENLLTTSAPTAPPAPPSTTNTTQNNHEEASV
jgi:hypothetical protein